MSRELRFKPTEWALILGASSGFGAGCAVELARRGMNIFGVHLDRQATMPVVKETIKHINDAGVKAVFFADAKTDEFSTCSFEAILFKHFRN